MKNNIFFFLINLIIISCISNCHAGIIVVTNTSDNCTGSLRQAMLDAESNAGGDTIVFNVPASDPNYNSEIGLWTIQPESELPTLWDDSTIIDGTTQTINLGNLNPKGPEIEIDGTGIPGIGIGIEGSNIIVKGLVINHCPNHAILVSGNNNRICGNYIGTDATGTFSFPNGDGIYIRGNSKHNIIGGDKEAERNIISGNKYYGIKISDSGSDSNLITGNYIGANYSGDDTLRNYLGDIYLFDHSSHTIIGGTTSEERNIICGSPAYTGANVYKGVTIIIVRSNHNRIIGNYIGTDKNAERAYYSKRYGILIFESQNNIIGGTNKGEANIITGYNSCGIHIREKSSKNNIIRGNFIGTDSSGIIVCGHCSKGISITNGSEDNIIGPGNSIAKNSEYGIWIDLDTTVRNTITRNYITDNDKKGIYISNGANDSLAPPLISEVTLTEVIGTACSECIVEIFSDAADEGAIYEGSVITDEAGNFNWEGSVTGPFVTATATDTAGNTSEFSESFTAPAINSIQANEMCKTFPVYPNAANDFITIKLDDPLIKIELYDIQGKIVLSQQIYGNNQVSIAHLNRGIYLYRIISNKVFSGKLVIRKD